MMMFFPRKETGKAWSSLFFQSKNDQWLQSVCHVAELCLQQGNREEN